MKNFTLKFLVFVALCALILSCESDDDAVAAQDQMVATDCSNTSSIFSINLDGTDCNVDIEAQLGAINVYDENVGSATRLITINGVANHLVGTFPNPGNPNSISESPEDFSMTVQPQLASQVTFGQGYTFGVLFSGVAMDPYTGEFFRGSSGQTNMAWNITTLQDEEDLGLDCNNAHVQPTGRYHYHGSPSNYLDQLMVDGSQMVKVGYAGDGFPIYYKYGMDTAGNIVALESGYRLKTTDRGGDGITAPDGCPNGLYFQDYEYVTGVSSLDECNGRTGATPESASEYYYVITDNFPSSPLCFSGTPDASFRFR